MLRTALAMLMIGGMAAWGQAQPGASGGAERVDRAAAYYHYALAHMYSHMAVASRDRKREYEDKAIENYKAAVKADPQTPPMRRAELVFPLLIGPGRTPPKVDPPR